MEEGLIANLRDLLHALPLTTYNRAHDYMMSGHVGPISQDENYYFANVVGAEIYQTGINADTLRTHCNCPAPEPCKHVGALAMEILRTATTKEEEKSPEENIVGDRELGVRFKGTNFVSFEVVSPNGETRPLTPANVSLLKPEIKKVVQKRAIVRVTSSYIYTSAFVDRHLSYLKDLQGIHYFFDNEKESAEYGGELNVEFSLEEIREDNAPKSHRPDADIRELYFGIQYFVVDPVTGKRVDSIYLSHIKSIYRAENIFYIVNPCTNIEQYVHDRISLTQLRNQKKSPLYAKWQHAFETMATTGPKLIVSVEGVEDKKGRLRVQAQLEFAYATTEAYLTNDGEGAEVKTGEKPIYCFSITHAYVTERLHFGFSNKQIVQHKTGMLIERKLRIEKELLEKAKEFKFPKKGKIYVPKKEYLPFLQDFIPKLKAKEILVRINDNILGLLLKPSAELVIKPSSGIDWFSGRIVVRGVDLDDMGEFIRAVRRKDELIRLKNGDWLRVAGTELEEVLRSLERLGIKPKADGSFEEMRLSQFASLEIEKKILLRTEKGAESAQEKIRKLLEINTPSITLGTDFKATLRPYQKRGVEFILKRHASGVGGILADDMGLGKTVQAIAAMSALNRQATTSKKNASKNEFHPVRFLVICPVAALGVWEDEIQKFASNLTVYRWHGTRQEKAMRAATVVLTTFSTYSLDVKKLTQEKWTMVFVDEAQFAKNFRTRIAQNLRNLNAEAIICLTGTPLENYLEDLWALFDLFFPGYLGTQKSFKDGFGGHLDVRDSEGLERRIRPFMLRRRKVDVLKDLPAKTESIIRIPMTAAQARVYEAARQLALEYLKKGGSALFEMLKQLTLLRRIACHPFLETESPNPLDSGKFEYLDSKLVELSISSEGVLIFSQYTSVLKVLMTQMKRRGIEPYYLDGKTSTKERRSLVARFQDGGAKFFLISLKAGGTALTLTRADTVIHLDPWWNPAVENQATDRAHRIGQTKKVIVYKLVSEGTVEEKVLTLQGMKRELFEAVIDNTKARGKKISVDDIAALLS